MRPEPFMFTFSRTERMLVALGTIKPRTEYAHALPADRRAFACCLVRPCVRVSSPGAISADRNRCERRGHASRPRNSARPRRPACASACWSRVLSFTLVSSGEQYMPQFLDSYYTDTIESLPGETGAVEEVVVSQYGQGSRAATAISEGLRFDVIASYDGKFSYVLVAVAASTSPSAMPILSAIADQLFEA